MKKLELQPIADKMTGIIDDLKPEETELLKNKLSKILEIGESEVELLYGEELMKMAALKKMSEIEREALNNAHYLPIIHTVRNALFYLRTIKEI